MAMAANYNCPLPISFWRAKFPHFWMRWPVVWRKENVCLMHLGLLNSTIRLHALCFILLLKVKKDMVMISWQWMWQCWHFMVGNLLTQWGVCSWGAWLLWSWVYGLQSWIPAGNERLDWWHDSWCHCENSDCCWIQGFDTWCSEYQAAWLRYNCIAQVNF